MCAESRSQARDYQCLPVTLERLPDLQEFSARYGKFGYCSCMRWRLTSSQFQRTNKRGRTGALGGKVALGLPVGVLAYRAGEPVGWCSVAPRTDYAGLERYKAIPKVQGRNAWSVVCFYLAPSVRRQSLTLALLRAAVDYALSRGADAVEGYPVEPFAKLYTYMGSVRTFEQAGFDDVTPEGSSRRVMRLECPMPGRPSPPAGVSSN